jgi:hypothetical protein
MSTEGPYSLDDSDIEAHFNENHARIQEGVQHALTLGEQLRTAEDDASISVPVNTLRLMRDGLLISYKTMNLKTKTETGGETGFGPGHHRDPDRGANCDYGGGLGNFDLGDLFPGD